MAALVSPRQLVLALDHAESFAREDFVAGTSNATALSLIDSWPDWPNRVMVLVGPEGCGKSHLASIWAMQAGARFLAARSLDDADLPGALATGALVLEDVAPRETDELALFHLLNLAREEGAFALLTARTPLAAWECINRDLNSRLRALPAVSIASPDDSLLRALIAKLAVDRQIQVDDTLTNYLVNRLERSFSGVRAAISQLDEEAMRRHRPVTRALAAELFRERST